MISPKQVHEPNNISLKSVNILKTLKKQQQYKMMILTAEGIVP